MPCSQLSAAELRVFEYMGKDDYFHQTIPVYGVCTRPTSDYIVEGKGSDVVYRIITLKVLPCSRPAGCKGINEIAKSNFQIMLPSSNFDVSNYENPHRFVLNVDDIFYINPTIKQMFNSKIKQVTIKDSGGIFPSWSERKVLYDIGSTLSTQVYTLQVRRSMTRSCACSSSGHSGQMDSGSEKTYRADRPSRRNSTKPSSSFAVFE